MNRLKAKRGFTLLELLVVLAVTAVITGFGTVAFFRMTDYWNGLQTRTELDRRAERVFASLRQDLSALISPSLSNQSLVGTTGTAQDPAFYGFAFADDTLTVSVRAATSSGLSAPVVVTYALSRDPSEIDSESTIPVLVREQRALQAPGDNQGTREVLAAGVLQLRVEYTVDGGTWAKEWKEATPPKAVRVSLTMADPVNPLREQIARGHVFPVHVQ